MTAVLLLASVIAATVATLLGFGVFDGGHVIGWLSLAVLLLAAHALVAHSPWPR